MSRFIETTAEAIGEEPSYTPTKWWLDTNRPLRREKDPHGQKFMAVQTEADKDPNNFTKIEKDKFRILYTDQAEYYFVCDDCHTSYRHGQWTGMTRGQHGWREIAQAKMDKHAEQKGWCQFCDPIFGNGGWLM